MLGYSYVANDRVGSFFLYYPGKVHRGNGCGGWVTLGTIQYEDGHTQVILWGLFSLILRVIYLGMNSSPTLVF